jgi:hypothetical protein
MYSAFSLSSLPPERLVYVVSLFLLSIGGFGVIGISSYTKVNTASIQLALTRSIWKFESETNKQTIYLEKCWAWRKLVLAGLMVASLISTMVIKLLPPYETLLLSGSVFFLWIIGIIYYWYYVVMHVGEPVCNNENTRKGSSTNSQPSSGASTAAPTSEKFQHDQSSAWRTRCLDKQNKDTRLPVTIITGFLGSGKTTLVMNILHNTVGMKVLVIENEVGEEGIDHELLMQHTNKEEIILMNNGCVCCTGIIVLFILLFVAFYCKDVASFCSAMFSANGVPLVFIIFFEVLLVRKDLLTTFHRMFSHGSFAQLDWVVIETTGK